jgi:secretory phospholipase A2
VICYRDSQTRDAARQTIACPAFQAAQKEACRCVAADKVASATRDRLVHFLAQSGVPEEELAADAVNALLNKYAGREPLMFFRLLMKYPSALKIDAAKRNFMDDVLRGAGDLDRANAPRTKKENHPVDEHVEL